MLVAWKRHRTSRRAIPFTLGIPELAMAGYVLVSLVSIALQHRDPLATTYLFYDRVFSPMCIYMLIRLWEPDEEDLRRLIPVVFLLAACQIVVGILSWIGPQYLRAEWLKMEGARTIGTLVNPSVYTVALIFSGGILVHAAMTGKSVVRLLYASAAALAFACVFLSLSRACWLAGLLALAGLVYSYPRQLVRLGIVSVLAVVIGGGLLVPNVLDLARERLASSQSERSAISRLPVYLAGLRMFLSKPLFGWGYGNFDRYDREFQGQVSNIADDNKDHASHNLYLTLFAEQGLLGGALFLGPMMWWFAKSRKKALGLPPEGLWSRKLLGVLWLSILAHLVVNNFANMRVPFGLGLWWVSLGLIASLTASAGGQRQKRETGAPAQESRPAPWR
jgi:O-antigen ligase